MSTMKNMVDAGLELYTCCEPVGPEHSIDEIVDNFFIGIDIGCIQHACMRRVAVKGTPIYERGQITELRLSQLCAVLSLTAPQVSGFKFMSVHEPNQIGFLSGANLLTAESGGNPRDTNKDTKENRGWTMEQCRKLLWETGFTSLRLGDKSHIPLRWIIWNVRIRLIRYQKGGNDTRTKIWVLVTVAIIIIAAIGATFFYTAAASAKTTDDLTSADLTNSSWGDILADARGETVNFYFWGGESRHEQLYRGPGGHRGG